MHDCIELAGQARVEVVADALGAGEVHDADRPLQTRLAQSSGGLGKIEVKPGALTICATLRDWPPVDSLVAPATTRRLEAFVPSTQWLAVTIHSAESTEPPQKQ